jgi:hypothetical protein
VEAVGDALDVSWATWDRSECRRYDPILLMNDSNQIPGVHTSSIPGIRTTLGLRKLSA